MDIMEFVKPELIVVAVVLYIIAEIIKKTELIKNKYIPVIIGFVGIVLATIYVLATSDLKNAQDVLMAIFVAITQGILVAGLSNYVNQIIKQAKVSE